MTRLLEKLAPAGLESPLQSRRSSSCSKPALPVEVRRQYNPWLRTDERPRRVPSVLNGCPGSSSSRGRRHSAVPGQDAAEGLVKRLAATVSAYDDRQVRSRRLCESDAIDRCNRKVWSRPPGHTAEAVPSDATEELAPSPMLCDDRAVRRRSLGTGLHKLRTCRGAASGFQEAVFPRTLQLPDFSAACAPRRHQRAAGTRVATHTAHDDSKVHDP